MSKLAKIVTGVDFFAHFIIATIMLIFVAPIIYWATDRQSPVTIVEQRLLTPEVIAGDFIRYEQTILRKRLCTTTIDIRLIDGGNRLHQFSPLYSATGGSLAWPEPETRIVSSLIPPDAIPGNARRHVTARFECNPIHYVWPIILELPITEFIIIERPQETNLRNLHEEGILEVLPDVVEQYEELSLKKLTPIP